MLNAASDGIQCPVCRTFSASEFLRRTGVPVHQNIVAEDQEAASRVVRGDLELCVCEACGFVFNRAFDQRQLRYGEGYDNTQSHSPAFNEYLNELARYMVIERGVRDARIVEVGCGRGMFLRKLVDFEGANNTGHGFDPSYVGPDSVVGGRLRFERRYYDEECADVRADVVVSRHVIEHVPNPLRLLGDILKALANSRGARIFLETPCLGWMLSRRAIWDLFYEHCSYFTAESLATTFEAAGFVIEDLRHVFDGQYLWIEASIAGDLPEAPTATSKSPGDLPALAREFACTEVKLLGEWKARIKKLKEAGGIAIWGAGAKGVTFAHLIDPAREWVECVVDLNPEKQGRYVPGTGHPIVSHRELGIYGVRTAILMNPNYRAESLGLLREAGLDIALV